MKDGYEDTNPDLNRFLAESPVDPLEIFPILSNLLMHLHMRLPFPNANQWRFVPSSFILPDIMILYDIADFKI